jgi:phosphoribosyl-ATP pyrophosphohydrolase
MGLLETLAATITVRAAAPEAESYTAVLCARGAVSVGRKVSEEATEVLIEAVRGDKAAAINESADVLYHLAVLWQVMGISVNDVAQELARREGQSGLTEKASRS